MQNTILKSIILATLDSNEELKAILTVIYDKEKEVLKTLQETNEDVFLNEGSNVSSDCRCYIDRSEVRSEKLRNIETMMSDDKTKILVIGSTSTGKSKIINCLMCEDILLSSVGKTTNRIVKIGFSDASKSLVRFENESESISKPLSRDELLEELENRSTTMGESKDLPSDPLIVIISEHKSEIFNTGSIVVDTPGYEKTTFRKKGIEGLCKTADIIVFVVTYNFSEDEKHLLETLSNKTSQFNIFVVVNKWDESDVDKISSTEKSRTIIENNILAWLENKNGYESKLAKERIYFVSAKEQMDIVCGDCLDFDDKQKYRNEEFDRLKKGLKNELENPTFLKCTKHEKNVDQEKMELEKDKKIVLDLLIKISQRRKDVIDRLEKIQSSLSEVHRQAIKKLAIQNDNLVQNVRKKLKESQKTDDVNQIVSKIMVEEMKDLASRMDEDIQASEDKIVSWLQSFMQYAILLSTEKVHEGPYDLCLQDYGPSSMKVPKQQSLEDGTEASSEYRPKQSDGAKWNILSTAKNSTKPSIVGQATTRNIQQKLIEKPIEDNFIDFEKVVNQRFTELKDICDVFERQMQSTYEEYQQFKVF